MSVKPQLASWVLGMFMCDTRTGLRLVRLLPPSPSFCEVLNLSFKQ